MDAPARFESLLSVQGTCTDRLPNSRSSWELTVRPEEWPTPPLGGMLAVKMARLGHASLVVASAALLSAWPASAAAQRINVQGSVRDSAGKPLDNADIGIVALKMLARSADNGRFTLRGLTPGNYEVSVRRLGYAPKTIQLTVVAGNERPPELAVTLEAQAAVLDAINVNQMERRRRAWIEDFHRRRVQGLGQYITRGDIRARNAAKPSDLFRNSPGIRIVKDKGLRFNITATQINSNIDCPPLLWIDGQKAHGLELDDIPLYDIEGVELYNGPSTTPMQFSGSAGARSCGTIVLWTRPPNTRDP
jgi:hypothetical protein